ncbi:MAG: DUF1279 domain-containing protein [archaeon]|nr:DUF1279 domain-containing protein [archaeon]
MNSSASPRRFASSSSSSGQNQQTQPPAEQPPAEQPPQSWYQRGKAKIKRYGKVGLATYVAVDLVSLAGLTLIIHNGLDLVPLLDAFHITHDKFPNLGDSIVSAWLVALACNKLTVPLRLPIAVAITPRVHEWWTGEPRHPPSSK